MKRIIDIDEDYYENLKYNVEQGQKYKPWEIIVNSTPYEERPKGEWIDYSNEGFVECPFCGSATNCEDNKDELHYCFNCGAAMGGEKNGNQN